MVPGLLLPRPRTDPWSSSPRAKAAGYTALVVTVDVPVSANRERDRRSGMTIPPKLTLKTMSKFVTHPDWVWDYVTGAPLVVANVVHRVSAGTGKNVSSLSHYINSQFDPSITWKDIALDGGAMGRAAAGEGPAAPGGRPVGGGGGGQGHHRLQPWRPAARRRLIRHRRPATHRRCAGRQGRG